MNDRRAQPGEVERSAGDSPTDQGDSSRRLAAYGTLAPGRSNHHQVAALHGRWVPGQVHGRLLAAHQGAHLGYPALVLDPDGPAVEVQLFESADLPAHWSRLDEFEGSGYRRVLTAVHLPSGDVDACVYVLAGGTDDDHV